MSFLKKLFFLIVFLPFAGHCFGQESKLTQFDHDSVKYLDELEVYLNTGLADKSGIKDFMKQFSAVWNSSAYNTYYKHVTYRISDLMLSKKMQVYPTFQTYLNVMKNFVKSELPQSKFDEFENCLEKQMKQKPYTNLNNFLSICENMFGSGVLFKSPTVIWSTNTNDYDFNCDSVQEIIFNKLDLKCANERNDTIVVSGTSGIYFPLKGNWKGNGGSTDWTRTGLAASDVYAQLNNYNIIFKEGGFVADSVTFWNKTYFDHPLEGRVVERDITEPKEKETYPRFTSYGKRFTIPNLTPDVTYNGGFAMRGRRFVGSGTKDEPAQLIFKRNNKPFLITSSLFFGITKDNIMTDDARIIFQMDGDSIFHPDIEMIYNINKKHVSLIRSTQGLSQAPFFDTYHKVNMFFEELSWYTDQPKIEFRMIEGNTQTTADFESQNYFTPELYEKLRDPSGVSPIVEIAKYSKSINSRDLLMDDLASSMHITSDELRPIIFRLATIGVVNYDVQTDQIHVEDKLFTFIDNRSGKADYDVLDYHSVDPAKHSPNDSTPVNDSTVKDNGVMNLNNFDISLSGVGVVNVSDSQNVILFPAKRHIVLHRNREASFAGSIRAGRFIFYGKQFDFDYSNFKIKMKNVDSLRLYANSFTKDSTGKYPLVKVKSLIRHLSGELIIDKTTNKSGLKSLKQYPILISDTNTFVYYDTKNIQNGVYKRDNFYFKQDPFTIDSLGSFSNNRLHFDGTFVSADIVPEMREVLRLQPDYSLGFIHQAPPEGLDLYKGKGKLFEKLKLSDEGLIGDGTLNYVTSVSKSNNFIFFPDSMDAHVQTFEVNEQKSQPEFPEAHGDTVYEHWLPKQNAMYVKDLFHAFTCYNLFATFHGTFILTPGVLSGNGQVDFLKAFLVSTNMKFLQHRLTADTASFNLKSADLAGIAFGTSNMKTDIDFSTRIGEFTTNGSGSVVQFPENKYIAYMDEFKWFIDQDDIELGSKKKESETDDARELQFSGSRFISVDPHQDSLQFISPQARFSLKTYQISAHKVPYIDVADARIVPDSGNIIVHKDAFMEPFINATITANKVTKYYEIYKADVSVTSRKVYTGSGYYDFVDGAKNKRPMYFSNIHVDTSHQTVANTVISDTAKFAISPYFRYKGGVTLKASDPYLYFDGSCRINHSCNEIKISWLKFSGEVDPNDVQIPVGHSLNDNNVPLAVSPVLTTMDSNRIYGAFLSPLINPKKDIVIVPDSGYLAYDIPTQQYRISNKEKLVAQTLPGNYVSLDTRKCIEYGEGQLNLGADLQQVDLKTVGNITDYIIPDSVQCNVAVLINFFFDDGAIDKMAADAASFTNLKPIDFSKEDFQKNLRELMGKDEADKLISQLTLYGTVKKLPKELQSQFFLSSVKLKWSNETHSYVSEGPIGVGSIGKTMINKEASGIIEVRKKHGGDELNVYLEFDPMHWYFFHYFDGAMDVVSSNDDFMNAINAIKEDKKTQKTDKGKFTYRVGQTSLRRVFQKRIYGE
jgi:hypothetical protein